MDHTETNTIDETNLSTIRKKFSCLRDGSYRIFHITKKAKEDSDDDDDNNIEQTPPNEKKSSKKTNRNGLKQFLFLHKTSRDPLTIEVKTPPPSPSMIHHDTTSVKFSKKTRQDNRTSWSRKDVLMSTIDETTTTTIAITHKQSLVYADKLKVRKQKQILMNSQPEIRASFHRRRKRFIVACGTVLIASSIIITIVVYVVIMTVKHTMQMRQLPIRNSYG